VRKLSMVLLITAVLFVALPGRESYAYVKTEMPEKYTLYTVKRGNTLWGISRKYLPKTDPRIVIERIRDLNKISQDYVIKPGDKLYVPDFNGSLTSYNGVLIGNNCILAKVKETGYNIKTSSSEKKVVVSRSDEQASSAKKVIVSRSGEQVSRSERPTIFEATAYCSCRKCCGKSDGITASGVRAKEGTVAVDPKVIPLGSRIYIEGMGYFRAEDTGGMIRGNKLDIWFPTHNEALKFGRKNVRVRIIA
jgi:3D (Asp-Asp-Asp) domain-containing protein